MPPIPFNPPDWIIQEYMRRKSPTQELLEGAANVANIYRQQKNQDALLGLKQQESDRSNQELAMKGKQQFYDYGDPSGLSPEIQQGMNNPAQGPATEQGARPMKSPIVQYFEDFRAQNPQGLKGQQFTEDTVLQKDSKGNIVGQSTYKRPIKGKTIMSGPSAVGTAKPQLRINQFTGEQEWYTPPDSLTPPGTVTQGSNVPHGLGTFRDTSKAAATFAEDQSLADGVISEISRVQGLNKNSRGGYGGAFLQKGQSALNMGTDSPEFKNTADTINTLKGAVSRVLKSTFGGQLSDQEREYLNQVYGAAEKMSPTERDIAMTNVKTMLGNKVKTSGAKYGALSGNTLMQAPVQDRSARLAELRAKRDAGTLQR